MKKNLQMKIDGAEVSWFAPLCDGDDDFLGNRNPEFKSSWENTSKIIKTADELGFRNVLCPSSYQVGQDTLSYVCLLYTSPSPRDATLSRMPSSA